ncbi:MAG: diguanylate cyclase, partial [Tepidisphaerales bacterium]
MPYAESVKLLVVEDDPDQLDLIRETLEDHFGRGSVAGACSTSEAVLHDLGGFDMILCDYNLPDASGLDLLDQVVKRFSTPVIMVTGENVGAIAAESIRRGACDYVVKVGDYLYTIPVVVEKNLAVAKIKQENEHLRRQLEKTLAELREKNGQLEESLQRVEELAATDPLTSLYNRRHFGRVLDPLFAEAQRYDKDLSCVMIDLDNYKQINDNYGHQVGDQLLVLAGRIIRGNLRRMDAAARYGGDEFVLLLPHADGTEAARVVQRIRDEFEAASAPILNRATGVTMSVGISSLRTQWPAHAEQLVSAADVALYQAKGAGRGRTVVSAAGST